MYKPGNIISLELKNFQNYKEIKFDFHPNLNFIAGPNGSGKSSISNAIAFIFGGTPKTIGKGNEIKEFVKFGELDGFVQIILKDIDKNLLIKRCINSNLKTTLWFLNNQTIKFSEIQKIYLRLKIDVNNLCNFLPQEKVIEFCKATPEQLFDNLINMLNLNEKRNKLDFLEEKIEEKEKNKENLIKIEENTSKSVNLLKEDLKKINEKNLLENNLKLMKIRKDWIIYASLESEYKFIKTDLKNLQKELKEKENIINELKIKIEKIEKKKINENHENYLKEFEEENKKIEDFYNKISQLLIEKEKIEKEKDIQIKKEEKNRLNIIELKNHIEIINKKINEIKIHEIPKKGNFDEKIELFESKFILKKEELQKIQNESINISNKLKESERIKQLIQSEDSRRLELLKEFHKDTYNAIIWLRKNKQYFKEKIIEPAFINLKIKNINYAPEIETFLGFQTLSSFICQTKEDYNHFLSICKDKHKLGINVTQKFPEIQKPKENIKNYGFEGFLIDFIDGPKEILEMLCGLSNFHLIPITKKEINPEKLFKETNYSKIITNNSYIEIRRSRYNKKDTALIKTPTLKKSKIFVNNLPELEEIEKEIFKLKEIQNKNNKKFQEILKEKEIINLEIEKYMKKRIIYKREIQKILREEENKIELKKEIENKNKEIIILKTLKKKDLKKELIKNENEFLKQKNELINFIKKSKFKEFFKELINLEKSFEELNIQLRHLKLQDFNIKNEKEILFKKIKEFSIKKEEKKEKILELKKNLKKNFSNEEIKKIELFPDILKELEELINKTSRKLIFLNVNKSSENEYFNKESQLNEILINKEKININIEEIKKTINEIKLEFSNSINLAIKLINKNFSNFFNSLKMDGKIEIEKNKRICKWKLNILVKFRKNEEFQLLRSSFQSGGEKSVSTILFLLSLIQISPSPFRLVDEINQGMDKFNERGVHNILVNLKGNTQFFIITPKIVDELNYNNNMKIFIIFPNTSKSVSDSFSKYKYNLISK